MLSNFGQVIITPTNTQKLEWIKFHPKQAPFLYNFDEYIEKFFLQKHVEVIPPIISILALKILLKKSSINNQSIDNVMRVYSYLQIFHSINFNEMDEIKNICEVYKVKSFFEESLVLYEKLEELCKQFGFHSLRSKLESVPFSSKNPCVTKGFSQMSYLEKNILNLEDLFFEEKESKYDQEIHLEDFKNLKGKIGLVLPPSRGEQLFIIERLRREGYSLYAPDFLRSEEHMYHEESFTPWKDEWEESKKLIKEYADLDEESLKFFISLLQPKTPSWSQLDGITVLSNVQVPVVDYDHLIFCREEMNDVYPMLGYQFWEQMEALGLSKLPPSHPKLNKRIRALQHSQAKNSYKLNLKSLSRSFSPVRLPNINILRNRESASSLKTYKECPTRYYVKYGLNCNPQEPLRGFEEDYLEKGSKIHKFLENLFKPLVGKQTLEIIETLNSAEIPQNFAEDDKELIRNTLDLELKYFKENPKRKIAGLEMTYDIKLDAFPVDFQVRIDRMDQEEDKLFVWDYKRGDFDFKKFPQLSLYYMALSKHFSLEFPNLQVGIINMKEGKRKGLIEENKRLNLGEYLEQQGNELMEMISEIRSQNFLPKPLDSMMCRGCFSRSVCEQ